MKKNINYTSLIILISITVLLVMSCDIIDFIFSESYTLAYDANGSTTGAVPTESKYYESNKEIVILGNSNSLEKEGYIWGGWNTKPDGTGFSYTTGDILVMPDYEVTLYAYWAKQYTITYYLDNGSNSEKNPSTYTTISPQILLNPAMKSGYFFAGWFDDNSYTKEQTSIESGSTGDIDLFAKWNELYTIMYTLDGGTNNADNPSSYHVESEDITLANPAKNGFQFKGWYSDSEYSTLSPSFIPTGSTGDKSFYARWIEIYTINYHLDGGTNSEENPPTYTIESAEIELVDPEKEGYLFDGWYDDSSFTQEISTIESGSTGDVDIHAKWNRIYTITYHLDGGINSEENPTSYHINTSEIHLSAPTKLGYTFRGWYSDSGCNVPSSSIPTGSFGDKSFYAQWTANTDTPYRVEHYQQHVSGDGYTLVDIDNLNGTTDIVVSASSMRYSGFYENTSHTNRIINGRITADGSLVLKRYYDRCEFTVRFSENGGSPVSDISNVRYEGTINQPNAPSKAGYTFDAWYKEASFDNTWSFDNDTITKDTILYAHWIARTGTAYTVEHYQQDTTGDRYTRVASDTEYLTGTTDTIVTASANTYSGFHENTSHESRIDSGVIAGNGSLVLKLYYDRETFTVSFLTDGGSTVNDINNVRYDASITEPTPSNKEGYTLSGWYKDASLDNAWNFSTDTVTLNITLYANWAPNSNTLTFDANGGSGTMDDMSIGTDEEVTLSTNSFTRAGYIFTGWAATDSGEVSFVNEATYTMGTHDDTLYAVWSANTDTAYKVEHYKQNESRTGYVKVTEDTESLSGTTDTTATAVAKEYTGFHENTSYESRFESGNIDGTGSLVLKLYYDWDLFAVSFSEDGGSTISDTITNVRYGTIVSEPTAPIKYGYTRVWFTETEYLNSWDFSADTVNHEMTLYAKWVANINTPYKVEHFQQTLSNTYTLYETENLLGITDTIATAVPKEYTGFHENREYSSSILSGNIAGFGSLILRLYYDRDIFTISFNSNGGDLVSNRSVKYDSLINEPSIPEKFGYAFGGWYKNSALTTIWEFTKDKVSANTTLHARWVKLVKLNPTFSMDYGSISAINGNTIFATGEYDDNGYVSVFSRNSEGDWPEIDLFNPDVSGRRSFGIDDNYAVVGSPYDDEYTSNSGSVYVYHFDSSKSWTQTHKLIPYNASTNGYFGRSVSISGDYIIVGSNERGVYLYSRNSIGGYDLRDVLYNTASGFGNHVFIKNDLAVVSAIDEIFIYKRNISTNTWSLANSISTSVKSIAFDGKYIIVGSYTETYKKGCAKIFEIDISTGNLLNTINLDNPYSVNYDYFGISVDINNGKVVVGAISVDSMDGADHNVGSISLYSLQTEGNEWKFITRFLGFGEGNRLGTTVGISEDYILGGLSNAFGNGANYIYELK